jgi:hypothetical protein
MVSLGRRPAEVPPEKSSDVTQIYRRVPKSTEARLAKQCASCRDIPLLGIYPAQPPGIDGHVALLRTVNSQPRLDDKPPENSWLGLRAPAIRLIAPDSARLLSLPAFEPTVRVRIQACAAVVKAGFAGLAAEERPLTKG